MKLNWMNDCFSPAEMEVLCADMVEANIRFQSSRISKDASEEDIKMRERRIKDLQANLADLRTALKNAKGVVSMESSFLFETVHPA
jgi:hypothetical protein